MGTDISFHYDPKKTNIFPEVYDGTKWRLKLPLDVSMTIAKE